MKLPSHHQRPRCAVCKREVDELVHVDDIHSGAHGKRVFVARCHGRQETVVVDFRELVGATGFGEAFTGKEVHTEGGSL